MRFLMPLTLLACLMTSTASAALLDRSIALVNHHVITESELMEQTRDISRQLSAKGVKLPPLGELYAQVLEHLILKQAQLDMADQMGIRIRDEEVNERLSAIAAQNKLDLLGLRDQLEKQEAGSFTRLRDAIREELTLDELRNKDVVARIRVTPDEVKHFIQRKLGTRSDTTRYRLQHILVALPEAPSPAQIAATRTKADGIWQQLKEGADFGQMAIRHSADSRALEGGDMGWMEASELPTILEETVLTLSEGDTAKPVQSPLGFHIVRLNAKEKSSNTQVPAEVEQQAMRILRTQKGNALYEQWLRRVRDEAYVKILAPEYARD